MINSSTFSTAGLNEIVMTQFGSILHGSGPPGINFASSSFILLQCVPQNVCAMNRIDMAIPPLSHGLKTGFEKFIKMVYISRSPSHGHAAFQGMTSLSCVCLVD